MDSSIKKYIIGGVIVVAFAGYLIFNSNNQPASVAAPAGIASNPPPASSASGTPPSNGTGAYKDGTYTGSVADAFYGNLQAVAVIQGGQLVDVQFPQEPNGGGHTQQVSAIALPMLKQEAIAAQSAQVNAVSGATQTSQAFQQSLASALAQAH